MLPSVETVALVIDPIHTRRSTPAARRAAADLLRDVRHDPDGFTRRLFRGTDVPQRSAWRTFRLAATMAARLSARAHFNGSGNQALWAEAFILLDDRMEHALALPFQSSVKRG